MQRSECELCGKHRHVGPFRMNDGQTFKALCGPCKVKLTLTPERVAKLQAEITHAVRTVEGSD